MQGCRNIFIQELLCSFVNERSLFNDILIEMNFDKEKREYPEILIPHALNTELDVGSFAKLYNLYPAYKKGNKYGYSSIAGSTIPLRGKREECEREYTRITKNDKLLQRLLFNLAQNYIDTVSDTNDVKTLLNWLKSVDENMLFDQLSNAPQKPIKPVEPKARDNSNDISFLFEFFGCLISAGIIFLTFSLDGDSIFPIILALPCLFAAIFLISLPFRVFSQEKEKISHKRKYRIELTQYRKDVIEYDAIHQKYTTLLSEFKKQYKKEQLLSISDISTEQQDNFLNLLHQANHPQIVNRSLIYCQKGISEIYFLEYLKNYYGNKILINTCLKEGIHNKVYPDFIYWDKSLNIIIDIEIDEPYVGDTGKPIHYIIEKWASTIDDVRDNAILSANWILMKFAEQQIFQQPEKCIRYIDWVIEKIKSFDLNFAEQTFLDPVTRWTEEEAIKMRDSSFRNTYIPENYYELLLDEDNPQGKQRIIEAQNDILRGRINFFSNNQLHRSKYSSAITQSNTTIISSLDEKSKEKIIDLESTDILNETEIALNQNSAPNTEELEFDNKRFSSLMYNQNVELESDTDRNTSHGIKSLSGINLNPLSSINNDYIEPHIKDFEKIKWTDRFILRVKNLGKVALFILFILLFLAAFVGIGCLFAIWLCNINPNETYIWYHGIWHGLFAIPNWVRSWFDIAVISRATFHSSAYTFWWWIAFIPFLFGSFQLLLTIISGILQLLFHNDR